MTRTRLHLNLDGLRVHGTRWQPCAGLRASPGFASIGCLPPRGLAVLWFCALGEFCKLGEFCSLVLNGHWGYCRGFPAPSVLGMLGLILLGLIHIAGVEALRGWMAMRVYCRQGLNGIVSSALPVL